MKKARYLVSACLAGCNCRFDGGNKNNEKIKALVESGEAIAVCPEELGELSTPRPPAEIKNNRVMTSLGKDVTLHYSLGALRALQIAQDHQIEEALLKSKSPMCGSNKIYDGSFSKNLIAGDGFLAKMLKERNIKVTEVD